MKLQVMICTHGADGLRRVADMQLPVVDGVGYLVSCQSESRPLPPALERTDVHVVFSDSLGLSNNRNNAIRQLTAPYALVADDDLLYDAGALEAVFKVFDDNPELDLATFRCSFPYAKKYPEQELDLRQEMPRRYFPISFEIAFRTEAQRRAGVWFSPLLGIGAPCLNCGEEDLFFRRMLVTSRQAWYYPVTLAHHPGIPTGRARKGEPATLKSKGALLALLHPATCWLRYPLEAYRSPAPTLRAFINLWQGAIYGLRHRKEILS